MEGSPLWTPVDGDMRQPHEVSKQLVTGNNWWSPTTDPETGFREGYGPLAGVDIEPTPIPLHIPGSSFPAARRT